MIRFFSRKEQVGGAQKAAARLRYILALDRCRVDGRRRVADVYSGPGTRVVFDEPLSILDGEELVLDYEITPDGVRGFATIQRSIKSSES